MHMELVLRFDRIIGLTKLEIQVPQCIDRSNNKWDLMHSGTPIEIGTGVQRRSRSKAGRNRSKQAKHLEASEPPKSPHK